MRGRGRPPMGRPPMRGRGAPSRGRANPPRGRGGNRNN